MFSNLTSLAFATRQDLRIHRNPLKPHNPPAHGANIASSVSTLWTRIDFSAPPAPLLQCCVKQLIDDILLSPSTVTTLDQRRAVKETFFCYDRSIRKLVLDHKIPHSGVDREAAFPILAGISLNARRDNRVYLEPPIHDPPLEAISRQDF